MATREAIRTGTDAKTIYCSTATWKGLPLTLTNMTEFPCRIEGHKVEVMHHYGDDGKHYCPTMIIWCSYCGGLADEPEPYECNKWGEK